MSQNLSSASVMIVIFRVNIRLTIINVLFITIILQIIQNELYEISQQAIFAEATLSNQSAQ